MSSLMGFARRAAEPLLRGSLGLVLVWIGALKFLDPSPVVGLLDASLAFLASEAFVYALGTLEVGAGLLLFAGVAIPWVSLGLVGLFGGTLVIFLIAPAVSYGESGYPLLTLPGEFLLKDAVLLAATIALVALHSAKVANEERAMPASGGL